LSQSASGIREVQPIWLFVMRSGDEQAAVESYVPSRLKGLLNPPFFMLNLPACATQQFL
jgi:hypothetical protein